MQKDNKSTFDIAMQFKDVELNQLKALKKQSDKRIKELERRCSQYSRLCQQHVDNLQKKNDEIWKLKAQLKEAEKFNKMQD